jgi:rhamnogalacturonyl hydrolase YesR
VINACIAIVLISTANRGAAIAGTDIMKTWARESSDMIELKYRVKGSGRYVLSVDAQGKPSKDAAFMWDLGVQLSALAAGVRVDRERFQPLLDLTLKDMESYWGVAHGIGGYAVLPDQRDPDRYYDDNAWVALALVEAYEATKDAKYLEQSKKTYDFVLSGEDTVLDGGIYWHEGDKNGKNTCSNGNSIVIALKLYDATKDAKYLETAKRLYKWAERFRDPADDLYWDNQRPDGSFEKTKWTYNTALMIRAECLLYETLKDKRYLEHAIKSADSAIKRWVKPETGAIGDGAAFAHHLFEAFLEVARVAKAPRYRDVAMKALLFVHAECRNPLGIYGGGWDGPPKPDAKSLELKAQASALRAYAVAAWKR